MPEPISIAIETSCGAGGAALGAAERLCEVVDFDARRRHATQLVARLADLLGRHDLAPAQIDELYASVGPGSFTGVRVGVTVARTLGQAVASLRCVAVPSPLAVAENVANRPWERLIVVLDARAGLVYAQAIRREAAGQAMDGPPRLCSPEDLLAETPRPLLLTGEGLGYHDLTGQGVSLVEPELRLPTAEGVWRVGRRLAAAGRFTEHSQLLPVYTRKPEAVRLWEKRHGSQAGGTCTRRTIE